MTPYGSRRWFVAFCSFAIILTSTFTPASAQSSPRAAKKLFSDLPASFSVFGVGTYKGMTVLDDVVLDDSGHSVRQADVVVNKPGESVVLVLSAYEPVVWRVGRTETTTIAGVVVSGYHGQAVIGLDKKIPIAVSTQEEEGGFPYFCAYKDSPAVFTMNATAKELVGKKVEHFYFKPEQDLFKVGSVSEISEQDVHDKDRHSAAAKTKIHYSDDRSAREIIDERDSETGKVKAKPSTLKQLVDAGKLRLASQADIDAWGAKTVKKNSGLEADVRDTNRMRKGRTYVIDRKITLPNGMFGAHSRSFIITRGAPFPDGPRCHNSFYLMDGTE